MIRHLVVLITLSIPLISIGQSYPNLIFHKTGSHLDAQFGTRLSGVGDQNGDGYNDFLVTEYSNLNQDSTTTYLFYGGDSIDNQPDYVWEGFRCQSTRNGIADEDYTGDGCREIALEKQPGDTLYFFPGCDSSQWDQPYLKFPMNKNGDRMVSQSTGDVNTDGYNDLLRYHVNFNTRGYIELHWGGPGMDTLPDVTWIGHVDTATLRPANLVIGLPAFINDDNIPDIVLEYFNAYSSLERRTINIFFGDQSFDIEPDTIINLDWSNSEYRYGFRYLDDFNGDSCREIFMSGDSGSGDWYVINGEGYYDPTVVYANLMHIWGAGNGHIVPCGDVNGDGYRDVLIGGAEHTASTGGDVRLYLGGPEMGPWYTFMWDGWYNAVPEPTLGTGYCIGWCGDVNGEGLNDIMFSAVQTYPYENPRGHVYIYAGDSSWVNPSVGVDHEDDPLPRQYQVDEPFPNPFNAGVVLRYSAEVRTPVEIIAYNLLGQKIEEIYTGNVPPGHHRLTWSPKNQASGLLFVVFAFENKTVVKKVILLK